MKRLLLPILLVAVSSMAHAQFQVGQVFVGVLGGTRVIYIYDPTSGAPTGSINTDVIGIFPHVYDITFDGSGNVYVAGVDYFNGGFVMKFDNNGNPLGAFGSGYTDPVSILHDQAGNFYVSQFSGPILKLSPTGALLDTYTPALDPSNPYVMSMALKADQKTLLYSGWGCRVKSYNLATKTQGPDYVVNMCPGGYLSLA